MSMLASLTISTGFPSTFEFGFLSKAGRGNTQETQNALQQNSARNSARFLIAILSHRSIPRGVQREEKDHTQCLCLPIRG